MAASALAIAAMVLSLVPMQAFADHNPNHNPGGGNTTPKIAICHATNSHSNPYNSANADETADAGGHDGHNGPVWFSGITTSWGDIIPPFTEGNVTYPGKVRQFLTMAVLFLHQLQPPEPSLSLK
jgi:hypothetical protein